MGSSDDPPVRDECKLLRRIPVKQHYVIWDHNQGRLRPTSLSFRDHSDGTSMSIALGDVLDSLGRSYLEVLKNHEDFALAAITAEIARKHGQSIVRDPTKEEEAHGLVVGNKKKADSRMAKASEWIVLPSEDQLSKAELLEIPP